MEIDDAWKTHNYGVLIKNGAHFNELFSPSSRDYDTQVLTLMVFFYIMNHKITVGSQEHSSR